MANLKDPKEREKYWNDTAKKALIGRTIKDAFYMSRDEADKEFGWHERGLVIVLDDGSQLIPSQDDEGNGPGALFTSIDGAETLPVMF